MDWKSTNMHFCVQRCVSRSAMILVCWIRIALGMRIWIRIQEGKNYPQKSGKISCLESAWCSLLRAEGFSCSLGTFILLKHWIRVRNWIGSGYGLKPLRIRIRIETIADPQHCLYTWTASPWPHWWICWAGPRTFASGHDQEYCRPLPPPFSNIGDLKVHKFTALIKNIL